MSAFSKNSRGIINFIKYQNKERGGEGEEFFSGNDKFLDGQDQIFLKSSRGKITFKDFL